MPGRGRPGTPANLLGPAAPDVQVTECTAFDPAQRPTFKLILDRIKKIQRFYDPVPSGNGSSGNVGAAAADGGGGGSGLARAAASGSYPPAAQQLPSSSSGADTPAPTPASASVEGGAAAASAAAAATAADGYAIGAPSLPGAPAQPEVPQVLLGPAADSRRSRHVSAGGLHLRRTVSSNSGGGVRLDMEGGAAVPLSPRGEGGLPPRVSVGGLGSMCAEPAGLSQEDTAQ